ncbi:MAG: leucine-rich repeat protein [Ruminococcus sp.]|nr:leucine-rich repeat protein [Ruminococcus sp.]
MGYAFISYSSKNQASADAIRHLFIKNKIDTWMAPYDIPVGSEYAAVINRALKDCACFVLLLTNDAQKSRWVKKEVERAINYDKSIITIKFEDVVLNDAFDFYLCDQHMIAIHKVDETSDKIKKVLQAVISFTGVTEVKPTVEPKSVESEPVIKKDESGFFASSPTKYVAPSTVIEKIVEKTIDSAGTCGKNLTWVLYDSGELVISGKGRMDDWDYRDYPASWASVPPWNDNRLKITSINIIYGVTYVGAFAFYGCNNLRSIKIPKSLQHIKWDAFTDCCNLANIFIEDDNNIYLSDNGVLFNYDKSTLIKYPQGKTFIEYIVPNTVKMIGSGAFKDNSTLVSVILPDSITNIGTSAFYSCRNLSSITIPRTVKKIGRNAFCQCDNLKKIKICNPNLDISDANFSKKTIIIAPMNSRAYVYARRSRNPFKPLL